MRFPTCLQTTGLGSTLESFKQRRRCQLTRYYTYKMSNSKIFYLLITRNNPKARALPRSISVGRRATACSASSYSLHWHCSPAECWVHLPACYHVHSTLGPSIPADLKKKHLDKDMHSEAVPKSKHLFYQLYSGLSSSPRLLLF